MNPNQELESIIALQMAMHGNSYVPEITDSESETNLANNLVGVYRFENPIPENMSIQTIKSSGGSGLRITTDGFILTACHILVQWKADWDEISEDMQSQDKQRIARSRERLRQYGVIDQQGVIHPLDASPYIGIVEYDIALIKAWYPERPSPIRFKTVREPLRMGAEIKALGIRDGKPYNQFGKVVSTDYDAKVTDSKTGRYTTTYDTFLTDAYAVSGFSGGVVVTMKGELAGTILNKTSNGNETLGKLGAAKVRHIEEAVHALAHHLGQRAFLSRS